jgi:hypothetical protein
MNQFQVFLTEKLLVTYNKEEGKMNRNDVYKCYCRWFYIDNIIVNGFITENGAYIPPVLRFNKTLSRIELYKLLCENYGEAPLINRKTKQYSYYLKEVKHNM